MPKQIINGFYVLNTSQTFHTSKILTPGAVFNLHGLDLPTLEHEMHHYTTASKFSTHLTLYMAMQFLKNCLQNDRAQFKLCFEWLHIGVPACFLILCLNLSLVMQAKCHTLCSKLAL